MAETAMERFSRRFRDHMDLILVAGIIGVLILIFVPLPTFIIDFLLVMSIALAISVLMTAIYIRRPLEFSVFPSLLLITTAFRLALNIATTRLILSRAGTDKLEAAGKVIYMFSEFVAGRDPVIGFVIFVILIIVQFVVITKGASRISEVAARFTLDAMPGKQMSIDADLNAGIIKEAEARDRRLQITREADFYGAMDGASKFVRGDAVAGIIITLVNIVGGFIIGYTKYNMGFEEAIKVFTKLTIGDGLVTQVPALIVSVSAGLVVTRATAETNLGREVIGQVFASPKALTITAVFLGILTFTGLPVFQLVVMGGALAGIAYYLRRGQSQAAEKEQQRKTAEAAPPPEKVEALLKVDPMELEIGYGLIRLVEAGQGGDLLERIKMIRRQVALDLGLVVPPIRIRDNMQLEQNQYVIKLKGVPVAGGTVQVDQFLAMDSGAARGRVEGIPTKEPAFGLPAIWVTEAQKQRAEALGYTVVDAPTVLATHLTEVIKQQSPALLGREDVNHLLATLKDTSPKLLEEVVPAIVKPAELQKILQALLREGVSIRDLSTIVETLGDYATKTHDAEILTEYVRHALARQISRQIQDRDGKIHVVTMDPRVEDLIRGAIERTETGSYLALAPRTLNALVERLAAEIQKLVTAGHPPVVLVSPPVRAAVKRVADTLQSGITVVSYNEVPKDARVESLGVITAEGAGVTMPAGAGAV